MQPRYSNQDMEATLMLTNQGMDKDVFVVI